MHTQVNNQFTSRINDVNFSAEQHIQVAGLFEQGSQFISDKDFFSFGLIASKDETGRLSLNIPQTIKYSGNGMKWGSHFGSSQRSLCLNILNLLLPELDWTDSENLTTCMNIILGRLYADFVSIIPEDGGRIPFTEFSDWSDTVRHLMFLNDIDELQHGEY